MSDVHQQESEHPQSPCIGVCSIDMDTNLCAGCFRTMEEISTWLDYTAAEKQIVLAKIEQRKQTLFDN